VAGQAADAASAVAAALPVPAAPTASTPAAALPGAGGLQFQTTGESWIEVRDADGRVLLSRLVAPGEQITGLQGALPLRLVVGNAIAVRVSFGQQAIDLTPFTRDNVARLQWPPP
jgi:cytoskeleton protein RodZ